MKEKLELRMYGLTPYNLSPIQQGIQFGHAVQEYNNMMEYGESLSERIQFDKWRKEDKTFIILNGGTTNNNPERFGTLNKHMVTLEDMEIKFASFYEPDLGDQLTAVVFLVDEYVFNKEKYPDPRDPFNQNRDPFNQDWAWSEHLSTEELSRVLQMRDFLKQFRLA
jgi:hypothetical protein